ncbi:MAG: transposase [Rhodanobacteraceae bacterium]|nr:transposase [Rhodanobacteraceae bacterium]MBL0041567.1 transposase [Xanthomonadales bacterium]MBP6078028.1 transposase [Xanthomonadales bacterium]MBP7624432.1 transposase [Xanthomonadales bacterium]
MRTYRRTWSPGSTYFFTVNAANSRDNDLLVRHVDVLRDAFRAVRASHPFELSAIVVLPDHLHCVWRLPEGDTNYPTRWRLIKSRFSRAIPANEHVSPSRWKKSERGLWQRRYWEHLIRDELDLHLHLDYIHFNPVKHGLVSQVRDWPHSSFHRFVDAGHYEVDWGASQEITKLSFE